MLPVCSATPCCFSHSQISFHGGLRHFCLFQKYFESRYIMEDRIVLGFSTGPHVQRISSKAQAAKSLYSSLLEGNEQSVPLSIFSNASCPNDLDGAKCQISNWNASAASISEIHDVGRQYLELHSISALEEGLMDLNDQSTENADSLIRPLDPEIIMPINAAPDNPSLGPETISPINSTLENSSLGSGSLDMGNESLSETKTNFDDFLSGVGDSINSSVNKGESAVKTSLDTVTSSITSITKSASEAVDDALNTVFSAVNQTGELAGNKLTSFSSDLKATASKATYVSADVLRATIIAVENSISKGASFVVYSYGSAKDLLPSELRDVLNASEETTRQLLQPIGAAFQQVYIAVEVLERSLGLDPNDPIIPFILFLGTSTTLWVFYWVWAYGGYSGDLSPKLTFELLSGKENAVLIDVRPEVLREREGVPDLRRAARFRYVSVTLPEVDGPVRKLLKGGRDLDDSLIAVVIQNLKAVQDRSKVIVMDADGNRSKGVARSLRKLGVKRPYLVQGGFQSWVKQGLRIKELKPETALTIINEEAEAILEDIRPSPVKVIGYGMGFAAATYALLEWEKTLQLIGVVGLGQTIYRRVASYQDLEGFKKDVSRLFAPVRIGSKAFSWVAGKLETNGIGLPTSPSSSDVQNRVLQAAAKHESQPSDTEGIPNPSPESVAPVTEGVDLSEA